MKLEDFMNKYGNVSVDEKELKELLGIKDEKYFLPKETDPYYFVDEIGLVKLWKNHLDKFDKGVIRNKEVFSTKEEAEEHAKKQRFLLKMKRDFLDNSDEIDWVSNDQEKYYLRYAHIGKKVIITTCVNIQAFGFTTTDRNWLEQYIKENEEEIKKYYFEIKEEN